MQPIRLGVIGAGLIWIRTHKSILATMEDLFAPVAFCDVSQERRNAVAQEYPQATVLSEYQHLLELPEVDAVLVLTPIALNAPVARAALRTGKHVIMEKPIARSVAEGRALLEMAKQAGKQLIVTEQMAYRHAEDTLAELIRAEEIGEIVLWNRVQHVEADKEQGPMSYASTAWRKQADFPLGTMFDGGIHTIAALSKVFGAPQSVVATGRKLRPEYGEYDYIATMFEYANGVNGMLSYSNCLPAAHNHFHVYGASGVIAVEQNRLLVQVNDEPEREIELPQENSYATMWRAIAQAFREQRLPYYTPEKALRDVAILEAVDKAIKSGGRVGVERI